MTANQLHAHNLIPFRFVEKRCETTFIQRVPDVVINYPQTRDSLETDPTQNEGLRVRREVIMTTSPIGFQR